MGFFGKLIDAIRGGNKEELGKLKDEALDKMNDVAKDTRTPSTRNTATTSRLPRRKSTR